MADLPRHLRGLALGAMTLATPVHALDWRLGTFFSQRVEADSNTGDDADGGGAVNAITNLGVTVSAVGPRTTFTFAPGVSGTLSSDSASDLDNIQPRVTGSVTHSVSPRLDLNGNLSVIPRLTNSSVFDDTETDGLDFVPDRTTGTVLEVTSRASAGFGYRIDPTRTLTGNTFARLRRIASGDNSDISETNQYGFTVGLSKQLSELTSVALNTGYRFFEDLGDDGNTSNSVDVGTSISHTFSPTLSGSLRLGGAYTVSDDDDNDNSFSFVGGGQISYRGPQFSLTAGVSSDIDQNDNGELEQRVSVFARGSYALTRYWQASLSSSLSFASPLGGSGSSDDVIFAVSPGVSYQIDENWNLGAGYRFRQNLSDSDEGVSNLIFLQVSRNLQLPL